MKSTIKIRADGYASALLGNRKRERATLFSPLALYVKGGIFASVVDKPADKALSGGITLINDNGILETELDRLKVAAVLADAVRWCRLTGGGSNYPNNGR